MRQNRLAQSLGLDETILSKIVNGFREPTPQLRKQIAGVLHSDADWLFERATPGGPEGPPDPGNGQPDGAARKKGA